MSKVILPVRIPGRSCSSMALFSSASGGAPCWISGVQLLRV